MSEQRAVGPENAPDPALWVDEHGDYLFRYALHRLGDRELAEDLVQEAFLAALRARERFAGRSTVRSWLVGILRHKIVDHFRRRRQDRALTGPDSGDVLDELFDARGNWRRHPAEWATEPARALEQREFREVLSRCLEGLPPRQAEAFVLREMEDLGSEETCRVLRVSSANLWVLLHRARMALWRCLTTNWFGT